MAGNNKNMGIIAVAVVAVAALAGGGFYFMKGSADSKAPASETHAAADSGQPAEVETAAGDSKEPVVPAPNMNTGDFKVEEGNPVVARVDGKDITRIDVYRFIQTMPPNVQQLPAANVYPMAMEQVINTRIVQNRADQANITETEEFQREMDIVRQQIARNIYLQKEVDGKINEAKMKAAYNDYLKKIPDVEERRARHILLDTEGKAKAALEKLNKGGEFEALAKELSIGPTAERGGDLGYFTEREMVPEFAEAVFKAKKGTLIDAPVKTQFGWHVIKVEDVRKKPKPTMDQVKPLLQADLRRQVLEDLLKKWRGNAKIEQFDINGKPLKDGANVIGIVPNEAAAKQDG